MNLGKPDGRDCKVALGSGARGVRLRALVGLVALVVLLPANVLWHGLPILWQDYPAEARRQLLSLLRGKTGPYAGVVW